MMYRAGRAAAFLWLLLSVFALPLRAATWFPLGPYGGDARSFAVDPYDTRHMYLGTATGWVYDSHDNGSTWQRLSQVANRNDIVIARIVADPKLPKRLIVAAWIVDRPDGGLYISDDGGKSWTAQAEMRGQSVRSLARSISDPEVLVAGSLRGVFESRDNGTHWRQISPAGSTELHEVESVAIDPVDSKAIYAGTWHLPWKTTDGGEHWVNIKEGIIDDSDVFSIIVDPKDPSVVYASACSGIYKSVSGAMPNPRDEGKRFDKVKGIPNTARRTRKLLQDPSHAQTVYAGTTEGLYRTTNGGEAWSLLTGPDVIINDVYVDPGNSNHVLLATDRGGVLRSEDGGSSFMASNDGFSARQIFSAYAADPAHPSTVYVGVVNDKDTGGVFQSVNGGISWKQQSAGLGGLDVFSLTTSASGVLLAGTSHGIYRWQDGVWLDSSSMPAAPKAAAPAPAAKPKQAVKKHVAFEFQLRAPAPMAYLRTISYEPAAAQTAPAKKKHPAVKVKKPTAKSSTAKAKGAKAKGAKAKATAAKAKGHAPVKKTVQKSAAHTEVKKPAVVVAEDDSAVPALAPARSSDPASVAAPAQVKPAQTPPAVEAKTVQRPSAPPVEKAPPTERAVIVTAKAPTPKPLPPVRTRPQVESPPPAQIMATAPTSTPPVSAPRVAAKAVVTPPASAPHPAPTVEVAETVAPTAPAPRSAPRASAPPLAKPVSGPRLNAVVYSLVPADGAIFAGTSQGLLRGDAEGRLWQPVKDLPVVEPRYISVQGPIIFVASLKKLAISNDGGHSWSTIPSPPELTQIATVAVDELKTLWVGGRQGLYYSTDAGATWKQLQNMYMQHVDGIYFDPKLDRILVTTAESPILFIAQLPDYRVSYFDTGWKLRFARPVGDHLLGATLFDGMVVQPEMVDSAVGK